MVEYIQDKTADEDCGDAKPNGTNMQEHEKQQLEEEQCLSKHVSKPSPTPLENATSSSGPSRSDENLNEHLGDTFGSSSVDKEMRKEESPSESKTATQSVKSEGEAKTEKKGGTPIKHENTKAESYIPDDLPRKRIRRAPDKFEIIPEEKKRKGPRPKQQKILLDPYTPGHDPEVEKYLQSLRDMGFDVAPDVPSTSTHGTTNKGRVFLPKEKPFNLAAKQFQMRPVHINNAYNIRPPAPKMAPFRSGPSQPSPSRNVSQNYPSKPNVQYMTPGHSKSGTSHRNDNNDFRKDYMSSKSFGMSEKERQAFINDNAKFRTVANTSAIHYGRSSTVPAKRRYADDDEDLVRLINSDLEVMPLSGKMTRGERLKQRQERLSQEGPGAGTKKVKYTPSKMDKDKVKPKKTSQKSQNLQGQISHESTGIDQVKITNVCSTKSFDVSRRKDISHLKKSGIRCLSSFSEGMSVRNVAGRMEDLREEARKKVEEMLCDPSAFFINPSLKAGKSTKDVRYQSVSPKMPSPTNPIIVDSDDDEEDNEKNDEKPYDTEEKSKDDGEIVDGTTIDGWTVSVAKSPDSKEEADETKSLHSEEAETKSSDSKGDADKSESSDSKSEANAKSSVSKEEEADEAKLLDSQSEAEANSSDSRVEGKETKSSELKAEADVYVSHKLKKSLEADQNNMSTNDESFTCNKTNAKDESVVSEIQSNLESESPLGVHEVYKVLESSIGEEIVNEDKNDNSKPKKALDMENKIPTVEDKTDLTGHVDNSNLLTSDSPSPNIKFKPDISVQNSGENQSDSEKSFNDTCDNTAVANSDSTSEACSVSANIDAKTSPNVMNDDSLVQESSSFKIPLEKSLCSSLATNDVETSSSVVCSSYDKYDPVHNVCYQKDTDADPSHENHDSATVQKSLHSAPSNSVLDNLEKSISLSSKTGGENIMNSLSKCVSNDSQSELCSNLSKSDNSKTKTVVDSSSSALISSLSSSNNIKSDYQENSSNYYDVADTISEIERTCQEIIREGEKEKERDENGGVSS